MSAIQDRSLAVSYAFFILILMAVGVLQLATVFVTVLFAYLALRALSFGKYKWTSIGLFLILLAALFYGFALFVNHAIVVLPEIASTAIAVIVRFATEHGIELPFTDIESLKSLALESAQMTVVYLGGYARIATKEFVFLIVGVVVALSIFINPKLDFDQTPHPLNLYSLHCARIAELFRSFYESFERVMSAQVIISGVNTVLTSGFVYATSLPYAMVVIVLTFLCGLLPVIGNLLSNAIIVGIAFTVSPQFAAWALLYLVVIHKLEYFLNSKIIGGRIRHPMWLTLLALLFGERLLGITGIILAPVILSFIKVQASKFEVLHPSRLQGP
ncbi:MAG TPA: AI-2E family transporter [Terrimicrobiaceae bacterium]